MTRRFAILICFLLAGIGGFLLWRASGPREPVYHGRTLSSWLDQKFPMVRPPVQQDWRAADEAIRHIGTNAIPVLLNMLRATDQPPFVLKSVDLARRLGLRWSPR